MRKYAKILLFVLVAGMVVQAGITSFAAMNSSDKADQTATPSQIIEKEEDIVIPQDVLNQIKSSDPADYDRNVANYKKMLVSLSVHPDMKQEIEKLVMEGYALPEILIGYEFLYHNFGKIADLRSFVAQQAKGASWKDIFTEYNRKQAEFKPRTFDSDFLEKLMSIPSINSDDIMIADRLSFATGKPFEDLIGAKQAAPHWQGIMAKAGVLFSVDALPRVQITKEQMQMFRSNSGLTEDQITGAFVIANKVNKDVKVVIEKIKAGYSTEAIFAESLEEKYR